jgi:hypothetical protein
VNCYEEKIKFILLFVIGIICSLDTFNHFSLNEPFSVRTLKPIVMYEYKDYIQYKKIAIIIN